MLDKTSPSALSSVDNTFPPSDRNTVSGDQKFMALSETPSCSCYLENPGSHFPAGLFMKKYIKIIIFTAASKCHMHCHSLLRATEHLLAQQEPCRQNWWTGHFGTTLSNPMMFQLPWGKHRLWYSCLIRSQYKLWTEVRRSGFSLCVLSWCTLKQTSLLLLSTFTVRGLIRNSVITEFFISDPLIKFSLESSNMFFWRSRFL